MLGNNPGTINHGWHHDSKDVYDLYHLVPYWLAHLYVSQSLHDRTLIALVFRRRYHPISNGLTISDHQILDNYFWARLHPFRLHDDTFNQYRQVKAHHDQIRWNLSGGSLALHVIARCDKLSTRRSEYYEFVMYYLSLPANGVIVPMKSHAYCWLVQRVKGEALQPQVGSHKVSGDAQTIKYPFDKQRFAADALSVSTAC